MSVGKTQSGEGENSAIQIRFTYPRFEGLRSHRNVTFEQLEAVT